MTYDAEYEQEMSDSPIFVVGRPRSGTTLMASLLDAHPRISIIPIETELFLKISSFPARNLTKKHIDEFCYQFESSEEYQKLEIPDELYRSAIDRKSIKATVKNLIILIGQKDAARRNKQRWGEKTPLHYHCLHRIFEAFPRARVIIMVRDPRGMLASLLKAPWNIETPEKSARSWNDLADVVRRHEKNPLVLPIHYEKLVMDPVSILQNVCQWAGEDYSPAMLERANMTERYQKDRGWGLQHRLKTLEKVSPASIDKWKTELDLNHTRLIEHLCGKNMERMGYVLSTDGLEWDASFRLEMRHFFRRIRSRFKYETKRFRQIFSILYPG
jgi:hypothetical protein